MSVAAVDKEAVVSELFSTDPEVRRCPFDHFDTVRRLPGLVFNPDIEAYVVSRYSDAIQVLRDPVLFSSKLPFGKVTARRERAALERLMAEHPELEALVPALKPRRTPVLVNCDPPQHMRQRRLVQGSFGAPRIAAAEPWIVALANELIDAFAAGGRVELVKGFCVPFPVAVIARLLGVGADRQADFKRWSDDFMRAAGNDGLQPNALLAAMKGQVELFEYLREQIEDRRVSPRDDLITSILNARQPGDEPFTVDEMLAMCSQFLVAGNETTTALIGNALLALARDPALADELRGDTSKVPAFLEEVLRLESPVQGVFRSVTADTVIAGQSLKAGDQVFLIHGAANRDSDTFGDKAQPDPAPVGRHISFGLGEHFCLGAGLARMEAKVAVTAFLERFAVISLPAAVQPTYGPTYMMRSLVELPLDLEPAA